MIGMPLSGAGQAHQVAGETYRLERMWILPHFVSVKGAHPLMASISHVLPARKGQTCMISFSLVASVVLISVMIWSVSFCT